MTWIRLYTFAWSNREILKGTIVELLSVGKLNTVLVKDASGKQFTTDRRALRTFYKGPVEEMARHIDDATDLAIAKGF